MENSGYTRFEITLIVIIALYYLPTIIAACRRHPQSERILTTNTLSGWTVLGWFWLLYQVTSGDHFVGRPFVVEEAWLEYDPKQELPCAHRHLEHTPAPLMEGGPFPCVCGEKTRLRIEGYGPNGPWISVPACVHHAGEFKTSIGTSATELVRMARTWG
jgi:hypothetical protein